MKVAIIDDISVDIESLKYCIELWGTDNAVEIEITCYSCGTDFMKDVDKRKFNICFIDIFMAGMDGIQVAKKLRESDRNVLIVFCTISSDYMPSAFSCHAFEYLLKPVKYDNVSKIMVDAFKTLPRINRYLELQVDRNQWKIFYSDICYITATDHYIIVNLINNNPVRSRIAFGVVANSLTQDYRFLQINRGVLVNMDYIIEFTDSGCRMQNGIIFPIHTGKRSKLQSAYLDFCFHKREEQIRSM